MEEAIALVLGPVILFVIVALFGAHLYEQRTKHLRQTAEEMGFTFAEKDPELTAELFGLPRGLNLVNVLRGKTQGLEVAVFDLHWAVPTTTHVAHIRFTILLFRDTGADWPSFCLRPTFYRSHLAGFRRGGQRLFANDPPFGRACILEVENEAAVSEIFTEEVRRFFAGARGLWIEAAGQRLMVTRGKLIAARDLQGFLVEAFRLRTVLETGTVEHDL